MSEDCPHCIFEKTEANCRGCFEGSHYRPKPITNYDRVISKTPEELAEWIAGSVLNLTGGSLEMATGAWLDWLRQEATE